MGQLSQFLKTCGFKVKQCYQTGQKLLENAKLEMLS